MKKVLKILSCFVCVIICLFSFVACGEEEEVYSNMTKSGFNNYLTNEETTVAFDNYKCTITEKMDSTTTFSMTIKTRSLNSRSISYVEYKNNDINADVYISQNKVYFKLKTKNNVLISTHAITLDFYAQNNYSSVASATAEEKAILNDISKYLTYIDASKIYNDIKTECARLDEDYSIKMLIKNSYDKYKINYSANEETSGLSEEYQVNTYLEFYGDKINKVEYVKSGKQINDVSFNNYELKITTEKFDETLSFPSDIDEYPVD